MFLHTLRPLRAAVTARIPLPTRLITPIFAQRSASTTTQQSSRPPRLAERAEVRATYRKPEQTQTLGTPQASQVPKRTDPRLLPYFVSRNNFNNLGIYQRSLRGGSLKRTLIKKAEGNLIALKQDLLVVLNLGPKDIRINNVTRHIEIKGHVRDKVVPFLKDIGF